MAHEFNEHRANKVMRSRVAHITGGYTQGDSAKAAHPSGVKRASGGAVKAPQRADGGPVKARADKAPRRASGGGVKGKGTTVNVIVSPQKGEQAPPPMAAMPPPPPPMPPKPPMMPPPLAMGPSPGMGGMPPPMPHSGGGRAYKKGGAVKSMKKKPLKMSGEKRQRAAGGPVNAADQKGKTGIGDRTPVQHSGNKSDAQNIGRGPVITRASGGNVPVDGGSKRFEALEKVGKGYQPPPPKRATGGPIYADGKNGKQMAWNKGPSGGGGGLERKAAARRLNPAGHEPWNKDVRT